MSDYIRRQCDRLITAMVGKEWAPLWWTKANKHFGGDTPEDVFKHTPEDVYKSLLNCAYGGW
jgi:hypothetical protein